MNEDLGYVRAHDGLHIAYRVQGGGPIDMIDIGGFGALFSLDASDEQPRWRRFEEKLGHFTRLIKFDLRGIGYSDRLLDTPTVDDWVCDAIAVLDATGTDRAVVTGSSYGVFGAIRIAALHPDRVAALILANGSARFVAADDYEIGVPTEMFSKMATIAEPDSEANDIDIMAPSLSDDVDVRRWWTRASRRGAGPTTAKAMWEMIGLTDVREDLQSLEVPALVIASAHNRFVRPAFSEWIANHLEGSQYVAIDAGDHLLWAMPGDRAINEIEEFLTGSRSRETGSRSIQAILFTDIVASTAHNSASGDSAWLELLARHDELAEREITRRGGRLVKRLGDGLLAVFDLASDAIDAAAAITEASPDLGIAVRAGLHVAEIERVDDDVLGLGVTIAARALGEAEDGEVLTTRAVAEMLAGSDFEFADRGRHELKGVPRKWRLFTATRTVAVRPTSTPRWW